MHKGEGVIKAPSLLRFWGRSITAVGQKWGKNGVYHSTVSYKYSSFFLYLYTIVHHRTICPKLRVYRQNVSGALFYAARGDFGIFCGAEMGQGQRILTAESIALSLALRFSVMCV